MPFGLYGWGRGFGWFAAGLIDSWLELPQRHAAKAVLEAMIRRTARSALSLQNAEGGWNWTLTRQETRPDSSTTAILGWFLLQASQIDELHEPCAAGATRAVCYLMRVTRRSGAVDFSQGETKDIGVYSMLFNLLPFTQGFCIRMMNAGHAAKVIKI
ncbi:Glycosyl Hydrolase Family 88 [compost metagenome]